MRRIAVITVGRSDLSIYVPVLRAIQSDADLELCVIASGAHLSPTHGWTVNEITAHGFGVTERVDMLLSADTPEAIAKSMGLGVIGFAQAYQRLRPDIVVVLGDRFDMHAAALAAVPFRIPLAHLHGGEVTSGAIDEAFRHAITKYSHLHFASTDEHANRIIQLGEEPWRITVSGAPSLDNLRQLTLLSQQELETRLQMPLDSAPLLMTFHPVTLQYEQTGSHIDELLSAIGEFDLPIVVTRPNADTSNQIIQRKLDRFAESRPNVRVVDNLGTCAYFSLMQHAAAMVGNSSSGIIEAASFELPVVNIGIRQQGRPQSGNVIHVGHTSQEIAAGIWQALQPAFRARLRGLTNIYGSGRAAECIVQRLKEVPLDERLIVKRFYDLPRTELVHGQSWNEGCHTGGRGSCRAEALVPARQEPRPPIHHSQGDSALAVPTTETPGPLMDAVSLGPIIARVNEACLILGGGQHAKVVIDALLAAGTTPLGVLEANAALHGQEILGAPVLGGDELLDQFANDRCGFTVGVGSTANTRARRELFDAAVSHGLAPVTVRHPTAIVAGSASISRGVQLLAGAIVNADARLEENTVINTGAIIEHDCVVERHAFIAPGVRLGGSVVVGEGAHVGIGATVRQGIRIGARAIVGAGAVVVTDVPPDVVVMGIPARIHKRLAA